MILLASGLDFLLLGYDHGLFGGILPGARFLDMLGAPNSTMTGIVTVMATPFGMEHLDGKYFWIWAIVCAIFCPLTYYYATETSGRTLEQIDQMFYNKPRALMGLNKENTRVIRPTAADEENRFRAYAAIGEKSGAEEVAGRSL